MPYYPDNQDRDYCTQLIRKNVCDECGGNLSLRYDFDSHRIMVVCNTDLRHDGIAREYKQPLQLEEMNILTRRKEMAEEHGEKKTTALTKTGLPLSGTLTKSQAMEILKLVYPDVPEPEIIRTAMLCRDFGLHPLMKEVYIIPFGKGDSKTWSTVLGINATRKMMARMGSFSYTDDTPRVMTEDEQKLIYGEVHTDRINAITKLETKSGLKAQGYGNYLLKDTPYGMDKGNTKANMAFIRSERQAFSRLFPDAVPQELEVVDEAYVESVGSVNQKTGEIIEAQVVEQPGEEHLVTPAEDVDKNPINKEQINNIVALLKEAEMSLGDLGKWMVERDWQIGKLEDIVVWQYEEILEAFKKGE